MSSETQSHKLRLLFFLALPILALACREFIGHRTRGPVIVFLVDTLRYDRMSAYGAVRPTTPAAQRLAREGVRYDAAYSVSSWTRPAVASLFTSRLPAEVGAIDRGGRLDPETPVLAQILRRHGWRTAAFCGNGNVSLKNLGFRRGFDLFSPIRRFGGQGHGASVAPADRAVGAAVDFVEDQADSRFFLYVHVMEPHFPYSHFLPGYENLFSAGIPDDPAGRERRLATYDALVRQADDQFAILRQALENRGFWKSALVVYVADHGEEFFEHGGLKHGHSLYEELVHIPMIVKAPGWGQPGRAVTAPASILDLLPSIAHWAGLPADRRWRGETIDLHDPSPGRSLYFSEDLERWRLYGMRRGSQKVIVSLNPPFRLEFDLSHDPGEQSPVRNSDPALVELLESARRREVESYGGLSISKTARSSIRVHGEIELPEDGNAYLSLSDRERFPCDPRARRKLPIDIAAGASDRLEMHFLGLDEEGLVRPRLEIESGANRYVVGPDSEGVFGPVFVRRRPATTLSASELSDVILDMKALGYLGGGQ
jgi:arylsulfatase A-like enzyme